MYRLYIIIPSQTSFSMRQRGSCIVFLSFEHCKIPVQSIEVIYGLRFARFYQNGVIVNEALQKDNKIKKKPKFKPE